MFLGGILFLFASCSTNKSIGNGAYSDISLVRDAQDYELKRLKEVNSESKAIFGIPLSKTSAKEGMIFRFNGIDVTAKKKIWPIISLVAISVATGSIINETVGFNDQGNYKLGLPLSSAIAIPISGAINNQIWSDASFSNAAWNANSELLTENPDIDIFLNPKYEIKSKNGIWTQSVKLKTNVMGARLHTDEFLAKKDED